MPGFTTHYLFGQKTYQSLPASALKQKIQQNHTAFSLGLQGPDIFFYYLPEYLPGKRHLGSVTHTDQTGIFLKNLIKSCGTFSSLKEAGIAAAYVCGFLGHYTLDTTCHPFIYSRTRYNPKDSSYYGRHIRLETEIDTDLLYLYQKKLPSEFHQDAVIALSPEQLAVVSTVLEYAYNNTYPHLKVNRRKLMTAIRSMQWGTKALYDPSGWKKSLIRRFEAIAPGYPIFSALIPSDTLSFFLDPFNMEHQTWKNPWNHKQISHESFFDLFEAAQTDYLALLTDANCYFYTDTDPIRNDRLVKLLHTLGSRCYHSGLDIDQMISFT